MQAALVRAWRGLARFDDRGSVREPASGESVQGRRSFARRTSA
ncbi:hypothetical protein DQ384_21570 [Sphaerisporangium album]|uniref:Uncharacterized protein n=1 Tax=Sphaerisporangium album TaxID=509200 RepID=A0A367FEZ6_9ACTN|nr:hypothetical protein DQ384_21570 [Sphaerisporangium album]